ncbi:hypothetical protein J6590_000044 [Homalodisca vitripennis]|nr:hypothetical protein J6590_000044 [Homalodisca vitripennis]
MCIIPTKEADMPTYIRHLVGWRGGANHNQMSEAALDLCIVVKKPTEYENVKRKPRFTLFNCGSFSPTSKHGCFLPQTQTLLCDIL